MYQLQLMGTFDRFTFEILARRWRPPTLKFEVDAIRQEQDAYSRFVYMHGLTGIYLTHHVRDIETLLGRTFTEGLRRDYMRAAVDSKHKILCIQKIEELLRRAGVHWVLLKGIGLSLYSYGNIEIRQTQDVDILIDESDIDKTIAWLKGAGFKSEVRIPRSRSFNGWRMRTMVHQCDLMSPEGVLLEVHWRSDFSKELSLPSLARLTPFIEKIPVGERDIPFLSGSMLAVQVARHAYRSVWLKWKWLYDTIQTCSRVVEVNSSDAQRLLVEPSARVSLQLAEKLMELKVGTLAGVNTETMSGKTLDRILSVRDSEIVRHNVKKKLANETLLVDRGSALLRHLAFQYNAFDNLPARLRYVRWRLLRGALTMAP